MFRGPNRVRFGLDSDDLWDGNKQAEKYFSIKDRPDDDDDDDDDER